MPNIDSTQKKKVPQTQSPTPKAAQLLRNKNRWSQIQCWRAKLCPHDRAAVSAKVPVPVAALPRLHTSCWHQCLLLALNKQEVTLFPNLSPKGVKTSEGCCQETIVVQKNRYIYIFFVCALLSIIQQCLYWKTHERWEHIFEHKHHSLGDLVLCHRVAGYWWHQKGEYPCCRSCSSAFTFSPNANLSLQISAIIY